MRHGSRSGESDYVRRMTAIQLHITHAVLLTRVARELRMLEQPELDLKRLEVHASYMHELELLNAVRSALRLPAVPAIGADVTPSAI
jgi:hypothetical protein